MIAVDTSSLRRYLEGEDGRDVDAVALAIEHRTAILPPVVLTEILSDPALQKPVVEALSSLPLLHPADGFWQRAGLLRARVIGAGRKSKVADALIAQSCIDHDVPLITNDRDFRNYAVHGLMLI